MGSECEADIPFSKVEQVEGMSVGDREIRSAMAELGEIMPWIPFSGGRMWWLCDLTKYDLWLVWDMICYMGNQQRIYDALLVSNSTMTKTETRLWLYGSMESEGIVQMFFDVPKLHFEVPTSEPDLSKSWQLAYPTLPQKKRGLQNILQQGRVYQSATIQLKFQRRASNGR